MTDISPKEAFLAQPNRDPSLPYTNIYGDQYWYNLKGQLHRDENDLPALIIVGVSQSWYQHGERHRVGNPALIYPDGSYAWYLKGQAHRVGGPATYFTNEGSLTWYSHGKVHNIDGPAVIRPEGDEYYFLDNTYLPYEEWLEKSKLYLPKPTSRYSRTSLL